MATGLPSGFSRRRQQLDVEARVGLVVAGVPSAVAVEVFPHAADDSSRARDAADGDRRRGKLERFDIAPTHVRDVSHRATHRNLRLQPGKKGRSQPGAGRKRQALVR